MSVVQPVFGFRFGGFGFRSQSKLVWLATGSMAPPCRASNASLDPEREAGNIDSNGNNTPSHTCPCW